MTYDTRQGGQVRAALEGLHRRAVRLRPGVGHRQQHRRSGGAGRPAGPAATTGAPGWTTPAPAGSRRPRRPGTPRRGSSSSWTRSTPTPAGTTPRPTPLERQAYERTYGAGTTLARASLTTKEAASLDKAPENLRSAFAMLLGEHMELIVDAQRATFAGSPEFDAAAAQVNANTATLTKAMGGIVGPKKAAEFQSAWANHVEGLMAYTAAVASKDEAAKAVAKENLDGFAAAPRPLLQRRRPQRARHRPADRGHHRPRRPPDRPGRRLRGQGLRQGPAGPGRGLQPDGGRGQRPGRRHREGHGADMPAGGSKTGGGGTAHVHP